MQIRFNTSFIGIAILLITFGCHSSYLIKINSDGGAFVTHRIECPNSKSSDKNLGCKLLPPGTLEDENEVKAIISTYSDLLSSSNIKEFNIVTDSSSYIQLNYEIVDLDSLGRYVDFFPSNRGENKVQFNHTGNRLNVTWRQPKEKNDNFSEIDAKLTFNMTLAFNKKIKRISTDLDYTQSKNRKMITIESNAGLLKKAESNSIMIEVKQ